MLRMPLILMIASFFACWGRVETASAQVRIYPNQPQYDSRYNPQIHSGYNHLTGRPIPVQTQRVYNPYTGQYEIQTYRQPTPRREDIREVIKDRIQDKIEARYREKIVEDIRDRRYNPLNGRYNYDRNHIHRSGSHTQEVIVRDPRTGILHKDVTTINPLTGRRVSGHVHYNPLTGEQRVISIQR